MLRIPWTEKPPLGVGLDDSNDLNDGLVGEWAFNEGAGGLVYNLADPTGDTDGTLVGPMWTAGKHGPALSFDGNNDFIDAGSGDSIKNMGSAFTVMAWIYGYSFAAEVGIIENLGSPDFRGYYLGMGTAAQGVTKVRAYARTDTSGFIDAVSTFTLSTNTWYHVAGVYDGTTLKLFINGKENNLAALAGIVTGDESTKIGLYDEGSDYWDGLIDNIAIWNRALTAAEIQQLYINTWQRYQPRVIPYAAAVAGISMSLVMQQMNQFDGGTAL